MKKQLILLLLPLLLLPGCQKNDAFPAIPSESTEPKTSEPETEDADPILPLTASFREDNMDGYDEETGRTKILDFDFQWVTVMTPKNPQAGEAITEDLQQQTTLFYEGVSEETGTPVGRERCMEYAREGLQWMGADFLPYAAQRTYELSQRGKLLSVKCCDYMYLGGAHGSSGSIYLNYDTVTGRKVGLDDLTENRKAFRQALLQQMLNIARKDPSVSGSISWLEPDEYEKGFLPLLRDGAWHLEGQYLIISSQEYELGPYAAGPVDFKIPLSLIKDLIKPEFLEVSGEPGNLMLQNTADLPAAGEISSGEVQEQLFLVPEGTVYNVILQRLETYEDGLTLRKGSPLWFCGEMKDCVLALKIEIPELIPNLMVSYQTADGRSCCSAIVRSGEDGHCFLMDITLP